MRDDREEDGVGGKVRGAGGRHRGGEEGRAAVGRGEVGAVGGRAGGRAVPSAEDERAPLARHAASSTLTTTVTDIRVTAGTTTVTITAGTAGGGDGGDGGARADGASDRAVRGLLPVRDAQRAGDEPPPRALRQVRRRRAPDRARQARARGGGGGEAKEGGDVPAGQPESRGGGEGAAGDGEGGGRDKRDEGFLRSAEDRAERY